MTIINGLLVFTCFKHPLFYENSRYILFVHLAINDFLELSFSLTMFLWVKIQLFVLIPVCYYFTFVASTTTTNTPLNLAVMCLERYVAICFPLRHSQICNLPRTYMAITVIWLLGMIPIATEFIVSLRLQPAGFFRSIVLCDRQNTIRTAYQADIRSSFRSSYLVFVWLVIVSTYLRIAIAARSASSSEKNSAKKARNTILLHALQLLLMMMTFAASLTDQLLMTLPSQMIQDVYFVRYYLVYIIPRVLSAVIYGLRDGNFRKHLRGHMACFQKQVVPTLLCDTRTLQRLPE
ncbi:odorant receptor 131-2-like [Amia ocellicauda]|uniref:odorant receptor 131-2-like n=1 Tax=Amia ocellicauda TaxID=2972642 RepID=UPI003463F16F